MRWFEDFARLPRTAAAGLHVLSAWDYLSTTQYNEMVLSAAQHLDPPIRDGASVFELGCGVGAALKAVASRARIRPAGSDMSTSALAVARTEFPEHASRFQVANMARPHEGVAASSFDHVVSFGALGMYLTHHEMGLALREALRIARPGASLVFTHFIEEDGKPRGTIVQPIAREDLLARAAAAGAVDTRIHPMVHQGDRFILACRKPLAAARHGRAEVAPARVVSPSHSARRGDAGLGASARGPARRSARASGASGAALPPSAWF